MNGALPLYRPAIRLHTGAGAKSLPVYLLTRQWHGLSFYLLQRLLRLLGTGSLSRSIVPPPTG